jgi:hypothetical protein
MGSTDHTPTIVDPGDRVEPDDRSARPPFTRSAQVTGNGISVNLSAFGVEYHDIEHQDLLSVDVREDAIVIRPVESGDRR